MASFKKRGSTWQYSISRMVNGKYKPIRKGGFKTKKEAQAAALDIENELKKGVVPHLKPENFPAYFKKFVDVFKADAEASTQDRYLDTHKTLLEYFEDKTIQEIDRVSYQKMLNDYGLTHARSTSRKLNTHIRACVKEAIEQGVIRVDFTRNAKITGTDPKNPKEKHLHFKDSESFIKRLYQLIRDEGKPEHYIMLLAITGGFRFGEIVGLTRKDFDFERNLININKTRGYTKRQGEGFRKTKNKQSIRKVKMDPATMSVFEELFSKEPENILKLVFFSPLSKYKVVSNGSVNKELKKILEDMKIKPIISIHGLRHTHASMLLYKKVAIHYVSERLGHKDIETTMNEYMHIVKEMRTEEEKISAKLFARLAI